MGHARGVVNDSEPPALEALVGIDSEGALLSRQRPEELEPPSSDGLTIVESCQSVWMFHEEDHQFCRVARGTLRDANDLDWRTYDRLMLHPRSDAFVVFLDVANTRVLRSWRHREPCTRCGGEVTSEMSVQDLLEVLDK